MSERVTEVRDETFENDVLRHDGPVIVDFGAPWCPPCRALEPTFEALAGEFDGAVRFLKLNIDDNPEATQRYGVRGIPTLILFREGREVERIVGAPARQVITRMIEKHAGETQASRA